LPGRKCSGFFSEEKSMPNEPADLDFERTMRAGKKALDWLMKNDSRTRENAARYVPARDKLRVGMKAMLDYYAWNRERDKAEDAGIEPISADANEQMRIDAKNNLLAEIANFDNKPLHTSMPENELSEIAFWCLSEALWAIITDPRTHRDSEAK
jgi:hypothetical protein